MDLQDLLSADAILPALKVDDKKQALQAVADAAARLTGLKSRDIYAALLEREQAESTGVGRGIATPHGRLPGITRTFCVFARLEHAIPFDSMDGDPVDLMFILLSPLDGLDHLKALARVARIVREPQTAEKLRAARDRSILHAVLTQPSLAHLPKAG